MIELEFVIEPKILRYFLPTGGDYFGLKYDVKTRNLDILKLSFLPLAIPFYDEDYFWKNNIYFVFAFKEYQLGFALNKSTPIFGQCVLLTKTEYPQFLEGNKGKNLWQP